MFTPVSGGKLRYRNRRPWLVLAKTSPVTYKIQCHARAEINYCPIRLTSRRNSIVGLTVKNWMGIGLLKRRPQTTCPLSTHLKLQ